ncbi:MAG: alpha/beta hydrolase family protein [Cellulosilyticaceae bacterium]
MSQKRSHKRRDYEKIISEFNKNKEISYVLFHEENAENLPLVIIAHGFNSNKFGGTNYALQLANEGFAVLCFDMAKHGDRYDGFMETITCDAEFGMALFTIIEESYKDVQILIEAFGNDSRIDIERICLSGLSHGANLCYYALSKNEKIKAAVSILGSPNFTDLIVYSMEKESQSDFTDDKEKELLSFVKGLDPYKYLLNDEKRPMLIINAENDDDVPSEFSKRFFEPYKATHSESTSTIDLYIADEFHFVSSEMIEKAIEWIKINL